MSTPVTRGELREELADLEQRLEQRFDVKLEFWGGALLARIERSEQATQRLEQRLLIELARHAHAIQESVTSQIKAIDEKYRDLPAQVRALQQR